MRKRVLIPPGVTKLMLCRQNFEQSIRSQRETSSNVALILEKLTRMENESAQQAAFGEIATQSTLGDIVPKESEHSVRHTTVKSRALPQDPPYWQLNPPRKSRCPEWCSCRCHSHFKLQAPWLLKTVFGLSTIEYMASQNPCNDRSCRGRQVSRFGVTFRLPKYILSRYISIALTYTPLEGPRVSLQGPRVMPYSHPLFMYANQGNLQAIRNLFAEGDASVYDVNPRGVSALMYMSKYPKVMKALVDHGSDLSLLDEQGRSPMDLFGNLLLSGQLNSDDSIMVKSVLDSTDYEETRGFSTLHKIVLGLSTKDLDSELYDPLVSINPVDSAGVTPLKWAVVRNDYDTVEKLLRHGADPNIRDVNGSTAIYDVHDVKICNALIDGNADLHHKTAAYGRTCVHEVCRRGDFPEVIATMVAAGADLDAKNADGETPLMNAIFGHATGAVQYLVGNGASLEVANISGQDRPINFAVLFNNHDALRLLLARDVDYTATNVNGRNVAHLAALYGDTETMLILAGANLDKLDINLEDKFGMSPEQCLAQRSVLSANEAGLHELAKNLLQDHRVRRGTPGSVGDPDGDYA